MRVGLSQVNSQWQVSLLLLKDAQSRSLTDAVTYRTTILACEKGGQWQTALHLFSGLKDGMEDAVIFNVVMGACTQASQWQPALHIFGEMQRLSLQTGVVSYTAAIDACSSASKWREAVLLLSQLQAVVTGVTSNVKPC